jgi:hypothetical protein
MDPRLENIFCCRSCTFWYMRDEEGPSGECKRCYWNVPPNKKSILSVKAWS